MGSPAISQGMERLKTQEDMQKTLDYFSKYSQEEKAIIEEAYAFAQKELEGSFRSNGAPFIEHPVNTALIACEEVGLQADCIAAVFLHEATRGTKDLTPLAHFNKDILTIVDGLNKISTIKPKDTKLEAENYKKLIVSYSKDPRVVVLKICDRLEIMRSLDIFPKMDRERKIVETLMLYIPLAHQLGLYKMKSELEDIYFKFSNPVEYRAITNKLLAGERDRKKLMNQFVEPLKQQLIDEGIKYKVKIRTKTAYSIWKKMQKQKVPFEGVFDVFAMRFIIDCEPDKELEHALCWKVFSLVTKEYESDTKRLRDWLSNPKPNGYECLHITVKNSNNSYLEVQIRTTRMDEWAENGMASHWSYKGIKREATMDNWLKSVRDVLEHPENHKMTDEDLPKPPEKEIFVFTPTGELRKISAGATVLDFAFSIHSGLGLKCTGGRINGKAASLKEKLKTADVVEIMSGKNQKPSPDWLNIVVTSKAKNKIRQKLTEIEFQKAAEGKELLERRLKNWKLELNDEKLAEILKKLQLKTVNALYAAIGKEKIDVADIKTFLISQTNDYVNSEVDERKGRGVNENKSSDDILVIGAKDVKGIDYKLAKCCNPVYGDDVFGFVTIKDGVKIHRISCPNATRLIERYPYRVVKVKWSENPKTGNFQTSLKVTAAKEASVINDIMDVINSFRASVREFNVVENEKHGTYEINMRIAVPSNLELDKVVSQIKNLRYTLKISRV